MRMRVEMRQRGNGTPVTGHPLDQPSLRLPSPVAANAKRPRPQQSALLPRLSPTATTKCSKRDASGTLATQVSGPRPEQARARSKTSARSDLEAHPWRWTLAKRRTSRTESPARRWQRLPCRYQGLSRRQQLDLPGLTADGLDTRGQETLRYESVRAIVLVTTNTACWAILAKSVAWKYGERDEGPDRERCDIQLRAADRPRPRRASYGRKPWSPGGRGRGG